MIITGTSHFESLGAAIRYYAAYGLTTRDVTRKLDAREIHVGKPKLKPGETLSVHKTERRYSITTQA